MSIVGCSASPATPDPASVVKTYLDAIAAGDATTAAAMDPVTIITDDNGDADVLRTDAVLSGAVERIANVRVDPDVRRDGSRDDARRVTFSYDLAGERVSSSLEVAWSDSADEWRLAESIAGRVFVQASTSSIDVEIVGYSMPGASVSVDPSYPRLFQWAYPAVYEVTPDIDSAVLVDPIPTSHRMTVSPGADTSIDIPVTRVPTPSSGE